MKSVRMKAKRGTILLSTVLVLALAALACGGGKPQQVEVTRIVPQIVQVEITRVAPQTVEVTRVVQVIVTATPRPASPTPKPTNTPQPTETPPSLDTGDVFALNNLATQESGGLKVDIPRVLIGRKSAINQPLHEYSILDDKDVVGEIIFRITNTTDKVLSVHPDQGTVVVGNEQIKLIDYAFAGLEVGEDFSGDIFPEVTVIGGIWFGIKRQDVPEISSMTIAFDGPFDKDLNRIGPDFLFELDISNHVFEPIPDELR